MKKLKNCEVENCIPTPSSCIDWNGGDIKFLDICDGQSLNDVIWAIEGKLESLGGEDLSGFDIDTLAGICGQAIPINITTLSIFNLIKGNEVCLNDKISILDTKVSELLGTSALTINLKCFSQEDNQGNSLSITDDQFNQLLIDKLCDHKARIEVLEGKIILLQEQVDSIDLNPTVDELSFATCINASVLPTSEQVINTSQELCDLETSLGDATDITTALSKTPGDLNAEFGLISGWNNIPSNMAENYGNLLLEVENLRQRIKTIEATCCAVTCNDVELGFTATYNEDNTAIIVKFTSGAGTNIPAGFLDIGSTIVITDMDDNTETFITSNPDLIANNAQIEVPITGLNLNGDLVISIDANMSNGSLTCSKCLGKTVKKAQCDYCEICASGESGKVIVIYESSTSSVVIENSTTTTTTSTTTTTTVAP